MEKLRAREENTEHELTEAYGRYVSEEITMGDFKEEQKKIMDRLGTLHEQIKKTDLQMINLNLAETMRKEVCYLRQPMTEFDERQVLRMTDSILLNADGTITVNFLEEVAIAALFKYAYTGEFPE